MTFLGNTITIEGMQPHTKEVTDFFSILKVPKTPKQTRRFILFFQYFKSFIPKLEEFSKLSRKHPVLNKENHKRLEALQKASELACTLSLRFLKAEAQYVISNDASIYDAE